MDPSLDPGDGQPNWGVSNLNSINLAFPPLLPRVKPAESEKSSLRGNWKVQFSGNSG